MNNFNELDEESTPKNKEGNSDKDNQEPKGNSEDGSSAQNGAANPDNTDIEIVQAGPDTALPNFNKLTEITSDSESLEIDSISSQGTVKSWELKIISANIMKFGDANDQVFSDITNSINTRILQAYGSNNIDISYAFLAMRYNNIAPLEPIAISLDDYGNTVGSGRVIATDSNFYGNINLEYDRDFYGVQLNSGTTYAISYRGTPTDSGDMSDPRIYGIYNSLNNFVAAGDDDGGIGYESLIFFTPTYDDTYYFDLGGYSSVYGTFTISVTLGGSQIYGTGGNDTLNGTNFSDYISGSSGNDTINGLGGSDTIEGFNDNDVINGGAGEDFISGGSGADTFVFDQTDAVDTITDFSLFDGDSLDLDALLTGYVAGVSIVDDYIRLESDGNNTIVRVDGDGAANGENFIDIAKIMGLTNLKFAGDINNINANDIELGINIPEFTALALDERVYDATDSVNTDDFYEITLTAGTKYAITVQGLSTGEGTDYYSDLRGIYDINGEAVAIGTSNGAIGSDSIMFYTPASTGTYYLNVGTTYNGGTYAIEVTLGGNETSGNNNNNTLNGSANTDYLFGGYNGNDTLNGNAGNDFLVTYNGNDTLNGGAGQDFMSGGAGSDKFVFTNIDALDTVTDFSLQQGDRLDMDALLTGYVAGVSDVSEFIRFENRDGNTIVQVDGDGSANGENFVDVVKLMSLTDLTFGGDINNVDANNFNLSQASDTDGNITGATVLAQDVRVSGSIDNTSFNDRDFYEVNLTNGVKYAISVQGSYTGQGTNTAPYINGIYDANGNYISAGNTYGGLGNDSLLFYTAASTGTFYVDVGSNYEGTYTIELTRGGDERTGNNNNNTFNGTGNTDYLFGGYNGNDTLNGNGGDDYLESYNGNDTLNGGAGQDFMSAGAGSDRFVFTNSDAMDTIADFSLEQGDRLDMDALLTGYVAGVSVIDEYIRFENRDGNTIVQVDGDGSANGENFLDIVQLMGLTDMTFGGDPNNVDANNFHLASALDTDGNITGAISLNQDVRLSGTIDNTSFNDRDFYEVNLTAGTKYALSVQGLGTGEGTSAVPIINGVYDANGNYVSAGNSYSGLGNDALLFYTAGSTGTYYFDIGSNYEGTYTIELTLGGNESIGNNNNNTFNGTNNTDYLFGGYDGNDTLYGAGGNDYLEAYNGDDTLRGGTGRDFMTGGAGADTFIFDQTDAMDTVTDFSISDGDVLDFSAILTGYDPMADAIEDFINVRSSGDNAIVSVDADGGGDNYQDLVLLLNTNEFDVGFYEGSAVITM